MPNETGTTLWKLAFPWMLEGIIPDGVLRVDARSAPNLVYPGGFEMWFERYLVDPNFLITSQKLADRMLFDWVPAIPTRTFATQIEQFARQIINSPIKVEDFIRSDTPPGPDWNYRNTPYQLPGYEFYGTLRVGGIEKDWSMFLIPLKKASVIAP